MKREDLNDESKIVDFYDNQIDLNKDENWIEFNDLNINFDFHHSPFESIEKHYREQLLPSGLDKLNPDEASRMRNANLELSFNFKFTNCHFHKKFEHTSNLKSKFEFDDCHYHDSFNWNDITLEGKIKFWNCSFTNTNFVNTTFSDLVDFYNCTFKQKVLFFKTDFKGTTVFSASTFEQNVLFTYALIEKLIIFRGTKFGTKDKASGLDLSNAIINGKINPFDIRLNDYKPKIITTDDFNGLNDTDYPKYEDKFEKIYSDCITKRSIAEIPIKNKRETFRILKEAFVSRDDISASIKYKALEKATIRQEQKVLLKEITSKGYKRFKQVAQIKLNQLNLWLNKYSNDYTSSYGRAFVFILLGGVPIFYLSAILSDKYCFGYCACDWNWDAIYYGVGDFATFLSPIHKIDYLGKVTNWKPFFQILDFLGRLIIGYGIYQFIQAFRKYR